MAIYEVLRDNKKNNVEAFKTIGVTAHFHNTIELLVVESGEIELSLNGKISVLTRGDIVLCNSFDIHTYKLLSEDASGIAWLIPKGLVKKYFVSIDNKKFATQIFNDSECLEELLQLFALYEKYEKSRADKFLTNSIGQTAFALIANNLPLTYDSAPDADIMKNVLFYIYENFLEDLTLKDISSKFGYTPNHFSYIFNSYMQTGLTAFINNLRAEHSAELIKNGSTVIDAAENSGFSSLRTFYRCFKSKYGVSPKCFVSKLKTNELIRA